MTSPAIEYGLLGEHLSHSHSPRIHALLGSYRYDILEKSPDAVEAFIRSRDYRGLNVTIPYKRVACACADELTQAAKRLGNANTLVVRDNGTILADNTDYYGFAYLVRRCGFEPKGTSCLVLGDGAAAQTARTVLLDMGARVVRHASRKGDLTFDALSRAETAEVRETLADTAFVVNATPSGMYPNMDVAPLVDLGSFARLEAVADLVYNPLKTRLIQSAHDHGIPAYGGLAMLVAQAKRSSDLFLGEQDRPDDIVDDVLSVIESELRCVALIGMPGCGKSTVGRIVAKDLGMEYVDIDSLVVERCGKSIKRIFEEDGEDVFRDAESVCVAQAFSQPNRVVACGGGVVCREQNRAHLRQNGPVVLLTRGLHDANDQLSAAGRPLSQAVGIDELRRRRAPLYTLWADLEIGPHPKGAKAVAANLVDLLSSKPAVLGD